MALAHAILATLLDSSQSGYDLRKCFEGSVGFFWQASFQQIYRELGKLEEQGLVQSEAIAQQGRPDKKVFAVTAEGEAFLQAWIRTPCEMAPIRDDLLVKMFAGFLVPKVEMLAELKEHRSLHQERLAIYQQIQRNAYANPENLSEKELFHYLTLCGGIQYEQGWLNWCEEAISILTKSSASSVSPQ
ncbi:MAG: PadR family transcriptional regulator [Leptolyngbyaceae cyanobacterium CRU_2_3]|nr:PadR family transcriptional regulator [Leptolyngbyaceae cyanobacterium CRU_2_3]